MPRNRNDRPPQYCADKKVEKDKKHSHKGTVGHPAIVAQPSKKTPQIDADTSPSNSVTHALYKQGEEPRVHHEPEAGKSDTDAE
jgi:hypothetical protein